MQKSELTGTLASLPRAVHRCPAMRSVVSDLVLILLAVFGVPASISLQAAEPVEGQPLQQQLSSSGFRLVHERYVDNSWELFVTSADGKESVNLTQTPDQHELYPQVSPDNQWVCFVVDSGQGRRTVRSVWLMKTDGSSRRKVADRARQPFWHPNSQTLAYLPQEYDRFNIVDYFTKGLVYYDIRTGQTRPHPNSERLHHLYNPCFSADGKWIASTVHAGMGFSHAILLIEAEGEQIINLGIRGCRPCLAADGRRIAWGEDDHTIKVAELDTRTAKPHIGKELLAVQDKVNKLYHVDFSPDGRFLSISRGPKSKGDLSKPGTHEGACEMVGIYAAGWDLVVLESRNRPLVDLPTATAGEFLTVTSGGQSNKESDWLGPANEAPVIRER